MVKDYLLLAFTNLKNRRLRSLLTVLGIVIGIAAVVSLISIGQGLQESVVEQFEQMGSDTLTIMGKAGSIIGPAASAISESPLTEKEAEIVDGVRGVDFAVPFLFKSGAVGFKDETINAFILGMPPEESHELFGEMTSFQVIEGRDLQGKDRYKILLGYSVAYDMFDKEISVRDKLVMEGQEFKVVGILKKSGDPTNDQAVYLPLDSMREIYDEPDLVSLMYVKVKKGADPDSVAEDVKEELRDYRDEEEDEETFEVTTAEQLLETVGNILGILTAVLVGIAGVSLLVGGIGIANTMYTSVLERTREIGIMKAVGARNRDVMLLFLVESGLLGMVGGAIGVIIGIGMSKAVEFAALQYLGADWLKASMSSTLILGALAFSFVVGSISGLMPAWRASRLKPVDALRYE